MSEIQLPSNFPGEIPYSVPGLVEHLRDLSTNGHTTSVRLHPCKGKHILPHLTDTVLWNSAGRYLKERPIFPKEPDWLTGAYYVQDASSMIIGAVLHDLQVDQPDVLDLCAAPGGKSTLIAEWLDGRGTLVSNEVITARANVLNENLIKSGYTNTIVTQQYSDQIVKSGCLFDIIVVDAPCSGEGLWRKTPHATQEWSPEAVAKCALRQRGILEQISPAVRAGGYLIYMTCTYNNLENDEQIRGLLNTGDFELVEIALAFSGIIKTELGHLLVPGKVAGEGQYISVLRKKSPASRLEGRPPKMYYLSRKQKSVVGQFLTEDYLEHPAIINRKQHLYLLREDIYHRYRALAQSGKLVRAGLQAGKLLDHQLIPSQQTAMLLDDAPSVQTYPCDRETAMAVATRQLQKLDGPKGWLLMAYQNNGLGWVKNLGKRINNYYR